MLDTTNQELRGMTDSQPSTLEAQPEQLSTESTHTEDTKIIEPGSLPQRLVASSHLAQEVVQPRPDDEENNTDETNQLLSNKDLYEHSEEPAKDGSVRDPMVSVPLATLQQLVQYCAQVVRESKDLKTRVPDLERDGSASVNQRSRSSPPSHGIQDPLETNLFEIDDDHQARLQGPVPNLIEDIWREVVPWQLGDVPEWSDEMIEREEPMLARCQTIEDVPLLLQDRFVPAPTSATLRLSHQISFWTNSRCPPNPTFNYGVMVLLVDDIGHGKLSLGSLLARSYQLRVLTRPRDSEPRNYRDHIWLVVLTFLILNTTFQFGSFLNPEEILRGGPYAREVVETLFTRRSSLEEVLGLTIPQLCHILHAIKQVFENMNTTPLEAARGPNFRIDDLNIDSLRIIGGLSVQWTPYLQDHLRLDSANRKLYILWSEVPERGSNLGDFEQLLTKSLPSDYLGASKNILLDSWFLNQEIRHSWALLFTTANVCTNRNRANYDQIPRPPWVSGNKGDFQKSRHLTGYRNLIDDPIDTKISKHRIFKPYAEFEIFENRIRQLVFYMDTQKPQGFRQLWRDKRDTLNYYTFWGVIIFGGLSVFLALFSLALSIAQTVASFRALSSGPSPASDLG